MRHREYLRQLLEIKLDNNLVVEGAAMPEPEPILPVNSPEVRSALINIMRKTGFTEEQIAERFGDIPNIAMATGRRFG